MMVEQTDISRIAEAISGSIISIPLAGSHSVAWPWL